MASGSFSVSSNNAYISGHVDWSEGNINNTNNTSDITATMYLSRTNSGYTTSGSGTFHVSINGTDIASSPSFSLTYNSNTVMVTGTVTVPHNADGTKSITIAWSGTSNVFTLNDGQGTAVLTTIPRASTVASAVTWTAGTQNLTVSLNVNSSSFHHHMALQVQKPDGTWTTVADRTGITGTTYTFVFTQSEITTAFQQLAQTANRPAQIYLDTYDSSNNFIGETNKTGTCYAASATTPTLPNFNIGDTVTVTTNPANSAFTHNLTWNFGSYSRQIATGVGTSYSWATAGTDANGMYPVIPNAKSGIGGITCTTYYNGVQVQSPVGSAQITATVVNSNPTFGTGYSYTDINSAMTAITGDASYIIQNNSTVQVTLPTTAFATARNSASMTANGAGYSFVLNGVTKTAAQGGSNIVLNFGSINASTNQSLTVTATDSRGFTTTTSITVKMLPYQAPIVTSTVSRQNNFENTTTLTLSGSISALTTSAQKNALTAISGEPGPLEYRYAENVANVAYPSTWSTFTYTTSGATYSATSVTLNLDNTKSYIFEIRATDKIQTSMVTLTVASGQPILFLDEALGSVGVGKFPTGTGTLETQSDAIIGGNLQVNGTPYVTQQVATIPATAGWYRIATSASGILNNMAEFEILSPLSSHHTMTKLMASIDYANAGYTGYTSLHQLNHSCYNTNSSGAITQARIVYNTTYSGNYAYLEVYCPNASSFSMTVRMIGGTGWSLLAPNTAGSIPGGYTSTTITLYAGGITATNGLALQDNGTNGVQFLNASGVAFDPTGNIKPRDNTVYSPSGSWNVINSAGQNVISAPIGSNGGQLSINNGRKAVSSANGEWRLEIVTMNVSSSGSASAINGSVTFPTAFTTVPNVMYAMITTTVGYVDVMLEPFISSVTTTGFSCKFTTFNTTQAFASGTLVANFLVFGK